MLSLRIECHEYAAVPKWKGEKLTKVPSKRLLSLFCGCGGLDLGFEQAGFRTELAYDVRSASLSSWNRNFSVGQALNRDIGNLTVEDLDEDYGEEFRPHGVIGGPPCQGFSLANRNGTENDPRNALVAKFIDLALQLHRRSPLEFIVMENVPAIAGKRGGTLLERQKRRLRSAGFSVVAHVLDAVHYSVPQTRKRLFLIAIAGKRTQWSLPKPHLLPVSVRDAIFHFPEPTYFKRNLLPSRIAHHPNHWCMTPKSAKFRSGELKEGYVAKRSFKTLKWDAPSYTVAYGNREVHVHPNCKRRLSVFEAMVIQGFPRSFVLAGTLSDQITQVSEAVPPPLAKEVALSVLKCLDSSQEYVQNSPSQASYPETALSTA